MKIGVVGGGPGGLYFARLFKLASPKAEVDVFERDPANATFGFGVAFSEKTLANLEVADPSTHGAILDSCVRWDGMAFRNQGREVTWPGFGLSGIERTKLLALLQGAATEVGVNVKFEHETRVEALRDYDVIVAADGARSSVRAHHSDRFIPTVSNGRARYMWLGTEAPFERTTFSLRRDDAGTFAIHGYPFAEGLSTLVIETDEDTWRNAELWRHAGDAAAPGQSDQFSARYLERVFAEDLAGKPLLLNNSKWLNFPTVRNRRWSYGNVVLLGDAAHTAHPSVASGTKMAMEDAIVLAEELAGKDDLRSALESYEARRRPDVEHVQERAVLSQRWWETVRHRTALDPEQLAFSFLTRAGAFDYGKLQSLVPQLTEAAMTTGLDNGDDTLEDPLDLPIIIRGRRLPRREIAGADGDSPTIEFVDCGSPDPAEIKVAAERARAKNPEVLIAAELPHQLSKADIDDLTGELHLTSFATKLHDAGCDILALPQTRTTPEWESCSRISEFIRGAGIATLSRWTKDQREMAITDMLAGRCDLVELVGSRGAG